MKLSEKDLLLGLRDLIEQVEDQDPADETDPRVAKTIATVLLGMVQGQIERAELRDAMIGARSPVPTVQAWRPIAEPHFTIWVAQAKHPFASDRRVELSTFDRSERCVFQLVCGCNYIPARFDLAGEKFGRALTTREIEIFPPGASGSAPVESDPALILSRALKVGAAKDFAELARLEALLSPGEDRRRISAMRAACEPKPEPAQAPEGEPRTSAPWGRSKRAAAAQ